MSDAVSRTSRRERFRTMAHYITAFVLALEGVAHLEMRPVPWRFIALSWISAATIVIVTGAHHRIEKHFKPLQAVAHLAEAAVCASLAILTYHEGKTGLPIAWLLATVLLGGSGLMEIFAAIRREPEAGEATTESDAAGDAATEGNA